MDTVLHQTDDQLKSAIIGISMLNSHFRRDSIQHMTASIKDRYQNVFFMLPNKPAEHTLAGYGYEPLDATRTSRRKFAVLHRHCRESIEALHLKDAAIVQWEQFEHGEEYSRMLSSLDALYKSDERFCDDARVATSSMYQQSAFPKKKDMLLEEQIDMGIHFLLEELAFILASPEILKVPRTEYLYHRAMPILTDLLQEKYSFVPPTNVSFALLKDEH
jgi:cyclo(L-tyrosyl-L-tyrosyl) synthase